jgi:NAD(P)H-dependent FMN reductase
MSTPKKVAVIIGSTRQNRIGPQVADFVLSVISKSKSTTTPPTLSLVDINDFNLPIFDEPAPPASIQPPFDAFAHDHSKVWSRAMAKYDGYIFVTAEHNFSIPGATKNAIDFLYHAWIGRPVLIVSYGIMGGISASNTLKTVLEGMHLKVMETRPAFEFPERNPEAHNMSPGVSAAFGGKLIEAVVDDWLKKTTDLLKGYGELIATLGAAPTAVH